MNVPHSDISFVKKCKQCKKKTSANFYIMAAKLKNISSLEDADSEDDIFEFLNFVENATILIDDSDDDDIQEIQEVASRAADEIAQELLYSPQKKRKRSKSSQSSVPSKFFKSPNTSPENFTEQDFHQKFRITKSTFQKLADLLESREQYIENRPHNPIPLEVQLMIGLRYYATGSYQNELCEFFSVHQTTIGRIVHRISSALEDILLDYIKIPVTKSELKEIQEQFYNIAQFANVIGIVATKHIPLNSPHGNENILSYRNSSGTYSLILQIICDSKCRIMHIDASSPGSMTNEDVFEASELNDLFERRGVLLGNDSYKSRPILLIPIASAENESEKRYNFFHKKTQKIGDTCMEMMLKRFPVLQNGLRVHISKSISIILALGVLHNFCILNKDPLP